MTDVRPDDVPGTAAWNEANEARACSVDGCQSPVKARGWCNAHYLKAGKYGDPLGGHECCWDLCDRLAAAETDDCVVWPRSIASGGYGHFYDRDGRHVVVHREALLRRVPLPFPTAVTRHGDCHNRACLNYRHLSWGTQSDNAMDRLRDDTHNRGERHGNSKLTLDDVRAIRASKRSRHELANEFDIVATHVDSIRRGRSWSWLADEVAS